MQQNVVQNQKNMRNCWTTSLRSWTRDQQARCSRIRSRGLITKKS